MSRRETAAPLRAVAGLLASALLAVPMVIGGTAQAVADDTPAFTINDDRITESSGLTRDTDDNLYWTVNDSGDSGRAFALDESGAVKGTINFRADVVDVEAVQYADNSLYVADIGDNNGDRQFVTVYLLSDPQPDDGTVLYHAYDFAYPDGPHDAETLLISGSGQLSLVTKGATGGIYQAPAEPSRSEVNTLSKVADAPAYVTDGQFLADGRIALRSYVDVSILDPNRNYRLVGRAATPFQPQGESLTQSLDESTLLVGSEGAKSSVFSMPIPDARAAVPSAGVSPPASPGPSPSASQSAGDPGGGSAADEDTDVDERSGPGRGGTIAALLVAAAVAAAAGAGVYFARGRRGAE